MFRAKVDPLAGRLDALSAEMRASFEALQLQIGEIQATLNAR
jgi:hypothetical protein